VAEAAIHETADRLMAGRCSVNLVSLTQTTEDEAAYLEGFG
jgi:hypothetical protein